ncbi:MAG: hypothetical protein ACFFDB_00725 [Promethearchaeota archaeon]
MIKKTNINDFLDEFRKINNISEDDFPRGLNGEIKMLESYIKNNEHIDKFFEYQSADLTEKTKYVIHIQRENNLNEMDSLVVSIYSILRNIRDSSINRKKIEVKPNAKD